MTQDQINFNEWSNPDNWSDNFLGFYFSKRDSRVWVPKRLPWMGWTVNLGRPGGVAWLVATIIGLPLLVVLVIVLAGASK